MCTNTLTDKEDTSHFTTVLSVQIWLLAPSNSLLYFVIMTHLSYFVYSLSSEVPSGTRVQTIHFGSTVTTCSSPLDTPLRSDCKRLRVPCTAISLVSWMRVLPAATCTVTEFIPSTVKTYEMLLSKVMRGCKRLKHRWQYQNQDEINLGS